MEKTLYNLTNSQKSIWLTEQFYKNTSINNIVGYLKIEKNVNLEALEKAFNLFILKNDSFKLKITMQDGHAKQYFDEFIYEKLEIIDLKNELQLEEFEKSYPKKFFSLNNSFLFRAVLLRLPNNCGILVLATHHLISDAWTMTIALNEIYSNYNKLISSEPISDEKNPSYLDFIKSNDAYLKSDKFFKDKEYWDENFKELPNIISFKKSSTSISSNRKVFDFEEKLINKIEKYCTENKISVYIFLLAIFGIYFKNLFNSNRFVIGNPILNRSNFKEKHTTGMFVTVMPFLFNVDNSLCFSKYAENIALEQKKMYRHIKYPYHEILNQIKSEHNFSGSLYDIVFSYQNANIPDFCKWLPNYSQVESLQIHIKNLNEEKNSLSIHYDYLTDIFSEIDIDNMHNRILNIISQALNNKNILVSDFEIVNNAEKKFLLYDFNNTKVPYPNLSNIVKEFEKTAKKFPQKIAVSSSKESLTYKELNNRANIVAKKILSTNIETNIIAFSLKRSISLYVTILGILKSGHTYMPIDPDYPIDRINFMLKNSGTKILITTKDFLDNIKFSGNIIDFNSLSFTTSEKNLNLEISPDKLAYIMYTSGSTGIPKAVAIKHYNVLNFANAIFKRLNYEAESNETVLSVTTVCFDIFVFETFPTLLAGLHLFIANELEAKSPKLLSEIIKKQKITKILTTPSRIQLLFDDEKYASALNGLKEIILGGEPFPEILLNKLKSITKARLLNMYGPTETTVYSCFKDLTNTNTITIGKPIDNTQIYILNNSNKLLPINVVGEICIGGIGVGAGYYKNPEKTASAFIENPYIPNNIIYKTGDLGYINSNNEIICLGRKDHQIKIRGYRIELDDISNNIMTYPNINKCIVIDKEDKNGKKYLVAYFVSKENIDINALKKYLVDILPNYMIPSYFIKLDKIPLTLNHKVDRKALPEPQKTEFVKNEIILPKTKTEKILYENIKKELKLSQFGINTDLFDFNIDSLDIIRIQTRLLDDNIKLNTQDFYKYRTIEALAKFIEKEDSKESPIYDEIYLKNINNSFYKHNQIIKFEKNSYKNILLIGATGYLGMHLLNEFINSTSIHITCIIRNKKETSVVDRLQQLYKFYFNCKLPLDRVEIIEGDITKKYLGIGKTKYNELIKNIDLVINSAANVRYYGNYEDFKKINVDLPLALSNFCLENNIKFIHISTLGVSGNYLINLEKNYNIFREDDFYIGQKYTENVYIQTKFEAEMLLYQKASEGLNVTIIRVGNLTGRYSDGHFQKNIEENAFYNILRMILKYKILPNTMLNQFLEFTPIDLCAKAINLIINNLHSNKYVFHLFNQNYLSAQNLLNILKEQNIDISILSGNNFKTQILALSKTYPEENILQGIVNDLDDEVGLTFNSTVQQQNIYTNYYLDKLNFHWPIIDNSYIEKIVNYMRKNKYI